MADRPRLFQHRLLPVATPRAQAGLEIEIFREGQVALEADAVGEPGEIGPESPAGPRSGGLAVPGNVAGFEIEQAGEAAKQARLAAAVRALDHQQFTGL